MTAAVFRDTPSMSIPLTQNTAPVLEFDCLYTHDTRKKTKKWQDGFLRYHTFNKRVLVYDVPRNLIGDMHWSGGEAVQCGDELSLERNGVMVEVAEQIGQTETDLTELIKKSKNKPTSDAQSPAPMRAIAQTPRAQPAGLVARSNTLLKHKSLNALLGTPRGPIGKAQLPSRSPFEERHANVENEDWTDGRPPKRPRIESAPAGNVTRITTTTPRPVQRNYPPLWARTTDAAKQKRSAPGLAGQQRLGTKEIIDLSDVDGLCGGAIGGKQTNYFLPGFSDDALGQSSPPAKRRPVTTRSTSGRFSSPAFQVQQVKAKPRQEAAKPHSEVSIARPQTHRKKSPELLKAREPAVEELAMQQRQQQRMSDLRAQAREPALNAKSVRPAGSMSQNPAISTTGQTLRLLSTSRKKRTLLCQDQLTKKPQRLCSNTDDAADALLVQADDEFQQERPLTSREKVEARLAKINKKKKTAKKPSPQKAPRVLEPNLKDAPMIINPDSDDDLPDGPPMVHAEEEQDLPAGRPHTSHEASALELARLDRRMLPPAAPRPKSAAQPPSPTPSILPPPAREDRTLRRVVSDSTVLLPSSKSKRVPGAPVRYTPSPTRRSRESTPASAPGSRQSTPVPDKQQRNPSSPPDRTAYKKKGPLQKSVSLNMTSSGTPTVMLSKPFQKPGKASIQRKTPKDVGPWSREAFDIFDWRPPGWIEEQWCVGNKAAGVSASTNGDAPQPPPGLSCGAALPTFGRPVA